jgi:hypothetical protein
MDMDYSPWYEDMKIFKHKELGKKDWDEVMQKVLEEINSPCLISKENLLLIMNTIQNLNV